MVSSSGTNVFLIPTVHYTTCSIADLLWPGRPWAPKRSHVTGSPQMQLEIPLTPNHLDHSAVPKARAPADTTPRLLNRLCQVWCFLDNSQSLVPNCIFHHWDLSLRGKLKQILVFSAISPDSRSSGAAVPVAWEGQEEGLALLGAGWSLSVARGVCCWLAVQRETGGPL